VTGTPISEDISTRLQRIAHLAKEDPQRAFLSLAHHIDIDFNALLDGCARPEPWAAAVWL
jgi:hypothetical protein